MPFEPPVANAHATRVTAASHADTTLTQRAARGDRTAIAAVLRRVLPRVRAIARGMTRNPAEADDATQVALVELWQHLGSFEGAGSLLGWARVLAWRRIARHLARTRRVAAQEVELPRDGVGSTPGDDAQDGCLDLQRLLARLPAVQRDALVLHHGMGWSLDEVSEATGAPANTVKSRMRLALTELRAVSAEPT